jgi:hypothetical protein
MSSLAAGPGIVLAALTREASLSTGRLLTLPPASPFWIVAVCGKSCEPPFCEDMTEASTSIATAVTVRNMHYLAFRPVAHFKQAVLPFL